MQTTSVRIVQKEVGGRHFSLGGGLRDEVGVDIFFRNGVEKEMGGRILSSFIKERGKLHNKSSLWCKKSVQRSSHCLPQQYLIIISRAPICLVLLFTLE